MLILAHNAAITRVSLHGKLLKKTPLPNVKQHCLPLGNTIHLSHPLHSSDFTPAVFTTFPFLFPFPRFPRVFVILSYCAICFLVGCLKCFLRQGDRQAVTRTGTVDLAAEEIWFKKKKSNLPLKRQRFAILGYLKECDLRSGHSSSIPSSHNGYYMCSPRHLDFFFFTLIHFWMPPAPFAPL